jgi:fucose 4-O-acetylase-like acetyltransferase
MIVFIIGIVILVMYPSKKFKVAALWIAAGLLQITLWGFYAYLAVFNFFPSQTAYGLFSLTCGLLLYSLNLRQTSNAQRILTIISLLVLGWIELLIFYNFYLAFPNVSQWNIMIDATSYIAFLIAAVLTLSCVILIFFRSRRQITSSSKNSS